MEGVQTSNAPTVRDAGKEPHYRSEFTFLNVAAKDNDCDFLFHQSDNHYNIIPDT
jgi:hypothetical protein